MTQALKQFLGGLDLLRGSIPLSDLVARMKNLSVTAADLTPYFHFSDERYVRNLLRRGDAYEALLLCFEAGQRTPIHDHAGSACGVRVIMGTAVETIFERNDAGWIYATGSQELHEGGVVGSNDMDTHQLSNLQAHGQRLVTLHIYTPPLGKVGNYSLTDNSVTMVQTVSRDSIVEPV